MWTLKGIGWKELAKRVWNVFWQHRVLDQSAALSFYFLLSIFPFLLFLISLLGLVLQSGPALHEAIRKYLTAIVPASASGLIDQTLRQVTHGSGGGKLSAGLVFTLWAATQGMLALIQALNVTYEVRNPRPWWKDLLVGLCMTFGALALISIALVLIGYGGPISGWLARTFEFNPFVSHLWNAGEWLFLLALVIAAFNVLYIVAPNVRHREWHWLMPGTVTGVVLWLLASFGFKVYLSFLNLYSATYGSIGVVIILLLWFYLTGIAVLVGGEVNAQIEKAAADGGITAPE